jgi:hypothetical protein
MQHFSSSGLGMKPSLQSHMYVIPTLTQIAVSVQHPWLPSSHACSVGMCVGAKVGAIVVGAGVGDAVVGFAVGNSVGLSVTTHSSLYESWM